MSAINAGPYSLSIDCGHCESGCIACDGEHVIALCVDCEQSPCACHCVGCGAIAKYEVEEMPVCWHCLFARESEIGAEP
jgi:hypothetical protein